MTKLHVAMTLALGVLAAPAFASETTDDGPSRCGNWYCAACPHVVKESLAAVPGVTNVAVSDKTKTAVVNAFDDTKADREGAHQRNDRSGLSLAPLYSEGMLWPAERPRAPCIADRRCRGRVGRHLLRGARFWPVTLSGCRSHGVARQWRLCLDPGATGVPGARCLPAQSSAHYHRLPHIHTERPGNQVVSNFCAPQQRRKDYDLAVDR